jgi:pyrroline-5-carboxylate reductase
MKLGIIGYGKMGSSIITGVVKSKFLKVSEVIIYRASGEKRSKLINEGFNVADSLEEVFASSDYILLAVKPQIFLLLQEEFKYIASKFKGKIIISIMAGINLEKLNFVFGSNYKYVLTMPNTPLTTGFGTTVISNLHTLNPEEALFVKTIFNCCGDVFTLSADKINEIIPVSGSFPAYVYYFVQGFVDAVEKQGIDKDLALEIAATTLIGSAKMIKESKKDINTLISDVCSKGGATIEGIKVFDKANLKDIIKQASDACINRAKELGK